MDNNKNKIQESALKTWIDNDYTGTVVASTGIGKTRIGILAIRYMYTEKLIKNCLIVVPTTNLRNNEWVNEIEAWAPEINQIVTIECIQTAYKFTEETHYDLIIVDEIHTTLSMEYRKVYEISYNYILGLTATIPHQEEYEELLNIIAPVIYSVNLNEAVKLKLITPYILYNLPVTFNRKERALYTAYTKMFTTAASAVKEQAFDYYAKVRTMKGHKHYKLANMFWRGMTMRRWLCYKAESKIFTSVEIIKAFPLRKWIIFCSHIETAEKLNEELRSMGIFSILYHSKMKNALREEALEAARSPLCRVICSVQALNTGYNLPSIDAAICMGSTSVELAAIQMLGRILRKDSPNKKGLFINLYVQSTQEEKWLNSKNKSFNTIEVSNIKKLINNVHGKDQRFKD